MSRTGLEIEPGGFAVYPATKKTADKVNAIRRNQSLVQIQEAPILSKSQVLFETGEHWLNRPCSCYTCERLNLKAGTCRIHGPRIRTVRYIADGIEFWPDCGKAQFGEPNEGEATYASSFDDPDYTGLGWINAPRPGCEYSGANCGGDSDGDDCDFYDTKGATAKWNAPTGFCRVLRTEVANNDRCSAWEDDDWVDWQAGQQLIKKYGRSDGY